MISYIKRVMQVRSSELIDDSESVVRGVRKLVRNVEEIKGTKEITEEDGQVSEWLLLSKVVEKFNGEKVTTTR